MTLKKRKRGGQPKPRGTHYETPAIHARLPVELHELIAQATQHPALSIAEVPAVPSRGLRLLILKGAEALGFIDENEKERIRLIRA